MNLRSLLATRDYIEKTLARDQVMQKTALRKNDGAKVDYLQGRIDVMKELLKRIKPWSNY